MFPYYFLPMSVYDGVRKMRFTWVFLGVISPWGRGGVGFREFYVIRKWSFFFFE